MSQTHKPKRGVRQQAGLRNRRIGIISASLLLSLTLIGILSTRQEPVDVPNPGLEVPDTTPPSLELTPRLAEQIQDKSTAIAPENPSRGEVGAPQPVPDKVSSLKSGPPVSLKKVSKSSSVQWASVSAKIQDSTGLVSWSTMEEQYTSHFEIERSLDAETFKTLGRVESVAGSQFGKKDYIFADQELKNLGFPRVYYRIRQIGKDKQSHTSEMYEHYIPLELGLYIAVDELKEGSFSFIYSGDEDGPAEVKIMNQAGELIWKKSLQLTVKPQRKSIDASIWEAGTYILMLYNQRTSISEQINILPRD